MANPIVDQSKRLDDQERLPVLDDALRSNPQAGAEEVIPIVEETATVAKQEVVTGRVRVRTLTEMVEELARAEVQREDVDVTRVLIDQVVESAPQIRTELSNNR